MFISYPILEKESKILHFTSTRIGGVSSGNYESLNLGKYSKDSLENIQKNFAVFYSEMNLEEKNCHIPFQTHENHVLTIDEDFLKSDASQQAEKLKGVDALITNIPNQCIIVSTADCVPILLYDTKTNAVAAIHSGWRSTRLRIAKEAVNEMIAKYGSNPQNIKAAIGVSISPEVYEVGNEVKYAFDAMNFDSENFFFLKNNKYHLDLWQANKEILLDSGLQESNIETAELCSYSDSERFFSARRQGIESGRMISGIMIKAE